MRELEIVEAPGRRLLAIPHRGPYVEIGPAFDRLAELVADHGLTRAVGELVGVYYDDPDRTAAAALRAHAGVTVDEGTPLPPGFEEVRLAPGRHAVARVEGPYANLYPAYVWLYGDGLARAGASLREGPSYEVYRNTPGDTAPEALVTDIFVPVR